MAKSFQGNVIRFDGDNQAHDNAAHFKICGVKLFGGSDACTAQIKDTDTNGQILWEGRVAADTDIFDLVKIRVNKKIHVDMSGTGPILYVYME